MGCARGEQEGKKDKILGEICVGIALKSVFLKH